MANIIGNNIKILRDNMGFSQSTIARFLNVDQKLDFKSRKRRKKFIDRYVGETCMSVRYLN